MSLFEKIKNIFTIKPINPAPPVEVFKAKKPKTTASKFVEYGVPVEPPKTKNPEVKLVKEPAPEYTVKQPKNKSKKGK